MIFRSSKGRAQKFFWEHGLIYQNKNLQCEILAAWIIIWLLNDLACYEITPPIGVISRSRTSDQPIFPINCPVSDQQIPMGLFFPYNRSTNSNGPLFLFYFYSPLSNLNEWSVKSNCTTHFIINLSRSIHSTKSISLISFGRYLFFSKSSWRSR